MLLKSISFLGEKWSAPLFPACFIMILDLEQTTFELYESVPRKELLSEL